MINIINYKSRGHKGDGTEKLVNSINNVYKLQGIALVNKIEIPIKVLKREGQYITRAYFEKKSTVDYIGIINGISFCFDAKETVLENFSLNNIKQHQINYMKEFEKFGGYSYLFCHFKKTRNFYFIPYSFIDDFIKEKGKTLKEEDIPTIYKVFLKNGFPDYIQIIKKEIK